MTDRVVYRSWMSDNLRWDALELRDGDIVISTPPKSGTTWTQRLVSLLLFDGPDLPAPMPLLSPWLDLTAMPVEHVVAALDAQDHRRMIKTHTPLDGLVLDDRVTYVGVGRDPRDAAMSMIADADRMDALNDFTAAPRPGSPPRGPGPHPMPPPPMPPPPVPGRVRPASPRTHTPLQVMRDWIDLPALAIGEVTPLATILHHLDSVWSRRHLPNVAAFHYADYEADLVGELRRLATALGIDVAPARAGELARHATLDAMRARSAELSPDLWESHESVFRGGGTTTWREIFTEADNEHYRQRVDELVGPGVAAWAHGGRRGNDPDA